MTGASRFLIGLVTCFATHEGISAVARAVRRRSGSAGHLRDRTGARDKRLAAAAGLLALRFIADLLHITERAAWLEAAGAGEYRMSTRGVTLEEQGFIHCSLRHQLRGVAEFLYADADADDLVVLVIDSDRVPAPLRYEAPEPGAQEYPHIYGPLPTGAVTSVITVSRDAAGRLVLPE